MPKRENPVPGRTIGEHGVIGDLDTVALVETPKPAKSGAAPGK